MPEHNFLSTEARPMAVWVQPYGHACLTDEHRRSIRLQQADRVCIFAGLSVTAVYQGVRGLGCTAAAVQRAVHRQILLPCGLSGGLLRMTADCHAHSSGSRR